MVFGIMVFGIVFIGGSELISYLERRYGKQENQQRRTYSFRK
jgi:hypothetical protein